MCGYSQDVFFGVKYPYNEGGTVVIDRPSHEISCGGRFCLRETKISHVTKFCQGAACPYPIILKLYEQTGGDSHEQRTCENL